MSDSVADRRSRPRARRKFSSITTVYAYERMDFGSKPFRAILRNHVETGSTGRIASSSRIGVPAGMRRRSKRLVSSAWPRPAISPTFQTFRLLAKKSCTDSPEE
ncbi:hypothetical protein ACNPQM_37625 [Streptomyces sp. NPDC056231]|uniref:hypothetical protein n=1 Tax=Streptomyces sp. NPDC056231 TaxID=3345755 RepID=UPI003AAFF53C